MKDTEILSTFLEPDPRAQAAGPARVLVFDACQAGVVLRALLFVEVVVGVGSMFGAVGVVDWVLRLSVLTGAALPATLIWLIAACSLKNLLARLPRGGQYGAGLALGALGEHYAQAAAAAHISPEIMHRVATMASGGMDILPHNGAVIILRFVK